MRLKNFVQRKLKKLQGALKQDLESLLREGSLATAIEHYRKTARVDAATAAEVVMALQNSTQRAELISRAKQELGELRGLLQEDLRSMMAEGETAAAVEWCALEAGIDPKAAQAVIEHLRQEDPAELLQTARSALKELEPAFKDDLRTLLQEGKAVEALERIKTEKNLTLADAAKVLSDFHAHDDQLGHECRAACVLQEMDDKARQDIQELLSHGKLVAALEKLKKDWNLDLTSARDVLDKLR